MNEFNPALDLVIRDWGRIPYREAWQRQKELVDARARDEITDTLVFCEHDPVLTLGRGAQQERKEGNFILVGNPAYEVIEVERGGLATYHGPGQVVIYPICKIGANAAPYGAAGLSGLISALERWVLEYLRSQSIQACLNPGHRGVWSEPAPLRKLASIGIAARHWISYHGLALNFATGKGPWQSFNPCGFEASVMSDMQSENHKAYTYLEVKNGLLAKLDYFFGEFNLPPNTES